MMQMYLRRGTSREKESSSSRLASLQLLGDFLHGLLMWQGHPTGGQCQLWDEKLAEEATGSKRVSSTPPWSLH